MELQDSSSFELIRSLNLNERIGRFIRLERESAGVQPTDLETALEIKPRELEGWEEGLLSPEADRANALFQHFGASSLERALRFFADLQLEIYQWKQAHQAK